jgi:hypothetical protein
MIEHHIAAIRFGIPKDSEDSPFDDTKCQGCGEKFGLELGQARKAPEYPEICTECYAGVMNLTPDSFI